MTVMPHFCVLFSPLSQIWQRKESLGGNLLLCREFSREIQKVRGVPEHRLFRNVRKGKENATFHLDTASFYNQAVIPRRLKGLCCRHPGAQ